MNGDLYATLVHSSGFTVLLNRVGRGTTAGLSSDGFQGPGMNVTLDDSAVLTSIHSASTLVSGAVYNSDGRTVDPRGPSDGAFDAAGTALLSSFQGLNAGGSWTLFIADVSGGDVSTLNNFTLDITELASVPEPGSVVEGSVAVLFLGGVIGLYRLGGPRAGATWWQAFNKWVNAV